MSCVRKIRNTSRCAIDHIISSTLVYSLIASRIIIVKAAFWNPADCFGRMHVEEEGLFFAIVDIMHSSRNILPPMLLTKPHLELVTNSLFFLDPCWHIESRPLHEFIMSCLLPLCFPFLACSQEVWHKNVTLGEIRCKDPC